MQRVDSLEKTLMLGVIGGRRKRWNGWDGWMASLTRWTWVWVNSGRWWWTGRPGVLWFMRLQSRTRLSDWTEWGSITMNKASGGDVTPLELFQILKDDAVTVLHSICYTNLENSATQIWKIQQTFSIGLEKFSFHFNPKEGQCQRMFKLAHNCTHFTC